MHVGFAAGIEIRNKTVTSGPGFLLNHDMRASGTSHIPSFALFLFPGPHSPPVFASRYAGFSGHSAVRVCRYPPRSSSSRKFIMSSFALPTSHLN